MSYEGYSQNICERGHRFDSPDLFQARKEPLCPICQSRIVLANAVDQTNGENLGYIPREEWEKYLHTPARTAVCDLGHTHLIEAATYLVPTEEQIEEMRQFVREWKQDEHGDYIPVYEYIKPRPKP